jgi:hypothetical protein
MLKHLYWFQNNINEKDEFVYFLPNPMTELDIRFEQYVNMNSIPVKYAIDIGAQDGPGPVYDLFKTHGYDGLCIEGNPQSFKTLCENLPQSNVHKQCVFVTPNNILDIFEQHNVPLEPFALKIDIDGYDYEVLEQILNKYVPTVIVAEINEKIPPPILFQTKYHPEYEWGRNHFFGFSLQSAYTLMAKHGYTMIQLVGGNNILCIRKTMAKSIPQIPAYEMYKRDYLENIPVLWMFPWNEDVHHWTQCMNSPTSIDATIADIINYFTTSRIQRGQQIGQPVTRDAFFIGKA